MGNDYPYFMRSFHLRWLAALILVGAWIFPLRAEYLKNTDFKNSIAGWHGDGQAAFLMPDGTEGPDGVPVIKIPLSHNNSRIVCQELDTHKEPSAMTIKVDVFASADFKRSKNKESYNADTFNWKPGDNYLWSDGVVLNVDFWIRCGSGFYWWYKLGEIKPGTWTTLIGRFDKPFFKTSEHENRTVGFCVPPGEGAIYIKNPSVVP